MNYNAEDIQTLNFKDAIRTRIEMYMGSADNQGVLQCIREIISNCIDEFVMGYGNKIIVELKENNLVKITDFGRGCPFGKREDGTEALEAIFMTAHSGGKFSDKTYRSVIGMNGIGGKGVALSAKYFKVESLRDNQKATLVIEKGEKKNFSIQADNSKVTGTIVEFIPDEEVYKLEEIKINFEDIDDMCKNWSFLNKGLTFELIDHRTNKKVSYYAKNGLLDLIADKVSDPVHEHPFYYHLKDGQNEVEIALQWTKGKEKTFVFTNGLENSEGGTSLTGLKTAITRNINKEFKKSFSGDMTRIGLVAAIACKIPNPSFANQTKTKINNPELRQLADKAFSEYFKTFVKKYPDDANKIKEFLSKEEKAEEAANRARLAVLTAQSQLNAAKSKKVLMSDKLKDANTLGEDSTLLIVEGKSAAAGMAVSRDIEHYGIMPIKGKIVNALSHPIEDVLENEEVKAIILALGCGILDKYNSKKLRYGKVAICCDADSDGSHIACLIMSLFSVIMPDFIQENRLCWLKAPLFKLEKGNKKYFYFNDEEFNNRAEKVGEVTRFKGLGELSAEDGRISMFEKENQHMEVLVPTVEGLLALEELMGSDVEPRKDFVFSQIDFSKIEV